MKKTILLVFVIFLAACGSNSEETPPPATPFLPPVNTLPPTLPLPTAPSDYPAPNENSGYLAPAPTQDITDAYPGIEPIWIVKAVGAQCEELLIDLAGTEAALRNAGIQLLQFEVSQLPVCQACDSCPSEEHYRALIPMSELAQAQSLGWEQEP